MTVPCGVATIVCRPHPTAFYPGPDYVGIEYELLLGLRKGALGAGTWSIPGGRLEPDEQPRHAAEREVLEETGLVVAATVFEPMPYNNVSVPLGPNLYEPWLTLYFIAWVSASATAELREPEKCEKWEWVNSFELSKRPLFAPLEQLVEALRFVKRPSRLVGRGR